MNKIFDDIEPPHRQLLEEIEDFLDFLKSEKITISKAYKSYKFKYKGEVIGGFRIDENSFTCDIGWGFGVLDDYLEGQPEEFINLFAKCLAYKCTNCREGRTGCSKRLGATFNARGKSYENICVGAFGTWGGISFTTVDGSMTMMRRGDGYYTDDLDWIEDILVSIEDLKKLILVKKERILRELITKEEEEEGEKIDVKLTKDEMEKKFHVAVKNLAPKKEAVEVDLTKMISQGKMDFHFDKGCLVLQNTSGEKGIYTNNSGSNSMETSETFSGHIKIEMRVKTDKYDIWIHYNNGSLGLAQRTKMYKSHDVATGKRAYHMPPWKIQTNEFIDIQWYLARDFMAILVNGDLWHYGEEDDYIQQFRTNPPAAMPIRISALSTPKTVLTVEHLLVTKL